MKPRFLIIYGIDAFFELFLRLFPNSLPGIPFITKPALMMALMAFVIDQFSFKKAKRELFILIFAFLGDVFLMFSSPICFPLGLFSFLLMQLAYMTLFISKCNATVFKDFLNYVVLGIIALYVYFFWSVLQTGVSSDLQLPVIIYAIALGSMLFFAFLLRSFIDRIHFYLVFSGAFLFVISDSLLAIAKFLGPFELNSFLVMLTYISAQLLLTIGLVKLHRKSIFKHEFSK